MGASEKCLPLKGCAFTCRVSPHPVTLHTFISHRQPKRHLHVSFIRTLLLRSGGFCRPCFLCLLCLPQKKKTKKKKLFFLVSVRQSVCLFLSMWLSSSAVWARRRGGHPVGDLIRRILSGEASPLAPLGPNRRGSCTAFLFPSRTDCLRVSVCVVHVFLSSSVYPPAKM